MASQPDFFFMCCKRAKFDINHLQAVSMREFINIFCVKDRVFNVIIQFDSGFYILAFEAIENKTINIIVCETIDECHKFIKTFSQMFNTIHYSRVLRLFYKIHETISEKDLLQFTFISDEQRNMEKRVREIKNARKEDAQEKDLIE